MSSKYDHSASHDYCRCGHILATHIAGLCVRWPTCRCSGYRETRSNMHTAECHTESGEEPVFVARNTIGVDTDLPPRWAEHVRNVTGQNPYGHIGFDFRTAPMGEPVPFDLNGERILIEYHFLVGPPLA